MSIIDVYNKEIYSLYKDLKLINVHNDYHKIYKIFEYYSCIMLTKETNTNFYEYNDIPTDFKIINNLSILDTGIDCCDLNDTIVQCKLRSNNLTWTDCSSFIASKTALNKETNQEYIRWLECIIIRNSDCKLSRNLLEHNFKYIDKPYDMNEFYNYCDELLLNPPITKQNETNNLNFELRDYQIEAIDLIKNQSNQNVIINLPTGSGKNVIIINSINNTKQYLILVPRIVLLYQLKEEFEKFGYLSCQIQCIGDKNNEYEDNKMITICVYNSIYLIEDLDIFDKIYIDEAHHIYYPEIYQTEEYDSDEESDDETSETESKESIEFSLSHIDKIKSFHKLNKIVYLSATVDPLENDIYYQKSINYMIDNKYLSDYQIIIPVFNKDPSNTNIANYLINNYSNIIIYCKSQAEGLEFNNLLNSIVENSSDYIDCHTSKVRRNNILNKFKNDELRFLVNVRILTEGFDAPITKGIMFLHLPSTRNTIIQCIGRSLRLHENKLNAKIILPYSTSEDDNNITNFINILSQYDEKVKKGKLSIRNEYKFNNVSKENLNDYEDIELITEQIYENINLDRNSNWFSMLEKLENYIKINNKRPSNNSKIKNEKRLNNWISAQQTNYNKEIYSMKNKEIKTIWKDFITKYKELFLTVNEKWYNNLDKVILHIKNNNKLPSAHSKNKEEFKLGGWIGTNKQNYKNKKLIMKNTNIKKCWEKFMFNYKEFFKSNFEIWQSHLFNANLFINKYNKLPLKRSTNENEKMLGSWISTQQKNYKKESVIMKDIQIRTYWEEFIIRHKELFKSNEEIWNERLNIAKEYILANNKIPKNNSNIDEEKRISKWISHQKLNYKKKMDIMKRQEFRKYWEEFIEEFTKFFK